MTVQALTTVPAGEVDPAEATTFIHLFHAENPAAGPPGPRLRDVLADIYSTGTYWHTPAELAWACQVAWRNSARCIGRIRWRSLRVRDRRDVTDPDEVAAESVTHLREATNGGRIRSIITVFAPDRPGLPGPRIWNPQLIRYAGYARPDGTILGDPLHAGLTLLAGRLGWTGSGGRFDVLPLIVQAVGEPPRLYPVPPDAVLEVPLTHPRHPWFAELGLRWHTTPVITDMWLAAGGISYPCCPFNGWYMATEVATRNLGDTGRYDMCPVVAARMGLDTATSRTLHRDEALVVLNQAVLSSFDQAGVTVADHHTESDRFLTHVQREERAGKVCPVDRSWIVPPTGPTSVFYRYYDDADLRPNFYRHPPPDVACPL